MSRVLDTVAALDAPAGEVRYGAVVGLGIALLTAAVNIRSISNDNVPNVLLPASILRGGDLELSEFAHPVDGPVRTRRYWAVETDRGVYSRYPIWTAVAALPVFAPATLAAELSGSARFTVDERLLLGVGRFAALGFTAVIAGALAVALRRYLGGAEAALLALLALLGTTLWHTAASQLSNQTLPVACIAGVLAILTREEMTQRRALAVGLLAGLAAAARLPAVFAAIAPLGVFLTLRSWRKFLPILCAATAVFPTLTLIYNSHAFGHPLATGYSAESADRFSAAFVDGALGLLFSPTCGLLVYSPMLGVGLLGGAAMLVGRLTSGRQTDDQPTSSPVPACGAFERSPAVERSAARGRRLAPWLLLGFAGQWLLFSRWWAWNGGLIFGGPRMLAETIPGLVLLTAMTAVTARRPAIAPWRRRPASRCLRAVLLLGCFSVGLFLFGTSAYDAVAPGNPPKPDWDASRDILSIYASRFGLTSLLLAALRNAGILLVLLCVAFHFAGRALAPASPDRPRSDVATPQPSNR